MEIKNTLEKLGLTSAEISIYLAGLKLGPQSATSLAREAKIARSLTYHYLSKLTEKGLVHKTDKDGKINFVVEAPSQLEAFIEKKRENLNEIEVDLKQLLPQLQAITTQKSQSPLSLHLYEGIEGAEQAVLETLWVKGKEVYNLVPVDNVISLFGEAFIKKYLQKREGLNFNSKTILEKSFPSDLPYHENLLREIRVLPPEMSIGAGITIFDDKTLIYSKPETISVLLIESAEVAQSMKLFFNSLWSQSTS